MVNGSTKKIDYGDVAELTTEAAERAAPLLKRWIAGESLVSIALAESLGVEAVERLVRTMMKGVQVSAWNARDEARDKANEYAGEVRRLRRLAAHVAKGGFGQGAMLTFVVDECANGLQFHRLILSAPMLDEMRVGEAFLPHLKEMLSRCGEVAKVDYSRVGLDDVIDEDVEGAPQRDAGDDAEGSGA